MGGGGGSSSSSCFLRLGNSWLGGAVYDRFALRGCWLSRCAGDQVVWLRSAGLGVGWDAASRRDGFLSLSRYHTWHLLHAWVGEKDGKKEIGREGGGEPASIRLIALRLGCRRRLGQGKLAVWSACLLVCQGTGGVGVQRREEERDVDNLMLFHSLPCGGGYPAGCGVM